MKITWGFFHCQLTLQVSSLIHALQEFAQSSTSDQRTVSLTTPAFLLLLFLLCVMDVESPETGVTTVMSCHVGARI